MPVVIFLLHPEHDPVAPVVGNIHVKKIVGVAGYHPEIKLAQAVKGFDQFGKMNVSGEGEVHIVRFVASGASSVLGLSKEMLRFIRKSYAILPLFVYYLVMF